MKNDELLMKYEKEARGNRKELRDKR